MSIDLKTLDELERLSNEATPKPWKYLHADDFNDWQLVSLADGDFVWVKQEDSGVPISNIDGETIAASRNALPDLIQAVRKMREALMFYSKHLRLDDGSLTFTGSLARDGGDRARACLKELGLG